MNPEANPAPRLRDELQAVDYAIEELTDSPQYDEGALVRLQVRRIDLAAQLHACEKNGDPDQ